MGHRKTMALGILLAAVIILTGCGAESQSLGSDEAPRAEDNAPLHRFQDRSPDRSTAVESAIELSKRYAELSERMTKLQQEKDDLADENARLSQQIAGLEPELAQAQKELGEANDLIIEMRLELNNWKTNILGYREENRKAHKAQLETLVKILKALGGEVKDVQPSPGSTVEPKQGGDTGN